MTSLTSAPSSLFSLYSSTLRTHRSTFTLLESLLSSLSFLLPTRFADDDTSVEVTLAVSSLFSLLNDAIYYHSSSPPSAGLTVSPSSPSSTHLLCLRSVIAACECVELAVEKFSLVKSGAEARRKAITRIETIKAVCRVLIVTITWERGSGLPGVLKEGGGIVPGERAVTAVRERDGERRYFGEVVTGRLSGREIRMPRAKAGGGRVNRGEEEKGTEGAVEEPRPKPADFFLPTLVSEGGERDEERDEDSTAVASATSNNLLFAFGELLHILRPVTSTTLANRMGQDSFVPWITALLMDMISNQITQAALSNRVGQQKDASGTAKFSPNHPTATELTRRKTRWMLYLLRAPVWGKFSGDLLRAGRGVNVPGTKWLMKWVLGWLVYVQKHHFMLESLI